MNNKTSRKEQLKLIKSAFHKLNIACESQRMIGDFFRDYLEEIKGEEKRHRGLTGNHGIAVSDAVKLFAVKRVFEYLSGDAAPELREYFHLQRSVFMAYALVKAEFRAEIAKTFSTDEVKTFLESVDYAALMNPEFN